MSDARALALGNISSSRSTAAASRSRSGVAVMPTYCTTHDGTICDDHTVWRQLRVAGELNGLLPRTQHALRHAAPCSLGVADERVRWKTQGASIYI